MRNAIEPALIEIGKQRDDLFVVDADNGPATRIRAFGNAYEARYVNVGCAEQNLLGVSAGIASTGKSVIAATFSIFLLGRAFEQARNTIAMSKLPVVLLGTHAGLSTGADGGSHCCPEDIALARSIPGMKIFIPACDKDVSTLLTEAINSSAPCYVRVPRSGIWDKEPENIPSIGAVKTLRRWKDGSKAAIVTAGLLLPRALEVAKMLESKGISTAVFDLPMLDIDDQATVAVLDEFDKIFTIEDHWPVGGIGDLVSRVMSRNSKKIVHSIAADHKFPSSGDPSDVLDDMGLSCKSIVHAICEVKDRR